jgi:hypothetical protein
VKTLERRLPDPRDRLRAIDERKQLVDQDTTRGATDWEFIVRQLTREAERRVTAARQEDGYAGSASAPRRRKLLPPTVFVSYVHFSDEHKTQVRKFATFLESVGVDVQLDSWSDTHRRKSWDDWILEKITTADYVLPIASPAYREVFEGRSPVGKRLGTQAEAVVIRELLYSDRQKWMTMILPVLLPGGEVGDIPLIMQPNGADHYVVEDFTVDGAEKLLRVLFDSPRYPRPPRGKPPYLPPKS